MFVGAFITKLAELTGFKVFTKLRVSFYTGVNIPFECFTDFLLMVFSALVPEPTASFSFAFFLKYEFMP